MQGEYGVSTLCEKRDLFLNNGANFIKSLYFDMCKLLSADAFACIYEKFVPNVDYYYKPY